MSCECRHLGNAKTSLAWRSLQRILTFEQLAVIKQTVKLCISPLQSQHQDPGYLQALCAYNFPPCHNISNLILSDSHLQDVSRWNYPLRYCKFKLLPEVRFSCSC